MTTLYLTEQHATVRKDHDTLVLRRADGSLHTVPLRRVDQVVVLGDVTLTAATIDTLLDANVEVSFCTAWGKFRGRLCGEWPGQAELRIAQHRVAADEREALPLARAFVRGKLLNMRTVVQRGQRRDAERELGAVVQALRLGVDRLESARGIAMLMGMEGDASASYFGAFGRLLSVALPFPGRRRRPPPDPVNSLLSFGYTVLITQVHSAVSRAGLDPFVGFLHAPRHGKPALALDLVEEFRPVIVDSTVLTLLNHRRIGSTDFEPHDGGVWLKDGARRLYLTALEERLDTTLMHPGTGETLSYRRCIDLQARLLVWHLTGKGVYAPFLTR